jgi:DNA polymerase III subunit epsilon
MRKRAIYYDTETTGVKPEKDRIIELAAYDPLHNRVFVQLINPECPIPEEATAIHGITNEMVHDAPTFAAICDRFTEFCNNSAVLIAHNNDNFDVHFLRAEFTRAKKPFPQLEFIDTLKWARRYRPDLPRHTLQFLRETYGIAANTAHRALDDVQVLHSLFSAMIDDLDIETVQELLQTDSSNQALPAVMPFGKHAGKPLDKVPKDYVQWLQNSGAFDKIENLSLKQAFEKLGFLNEAVLL